PVSGSVMSSLRNRARPSFSLNRSSQGRALVSMASMEDASKEEWKQETPPLEDGGVSRGEGRCWAGRGAIGRGAKANGDAPFSIARAVPGSSFFSQDFTSA